MRVLKGNSITEKEVEKAERQDEEIRGGTREWPYNTHTQISTLYIAPGVTRNKHKVNINRTAHSFS